LKLNETGRSFVVSNTYTSRQRRLVLEGQLPSSVFLLDLKSLEKEKPDGRLYDAAKAILRDFMLERARQTDAGIRRTPDEAARYLGVSRPTYFNWSRPA